MSWILRSPFCMEVVEKVDTGGLELRTGTSLVTTGGLVCPSMAALDWIVFLLKDCLPLSSSKALWDMTECSSRLGGIVSADHGENGKMILHDRKPHFLLVILRVIEMQDTHQISAAALCRWPACSLKSNAIFQNEKIYQFLWTVNYENIAINYSCLVWMH